MSEGELKKRIREKWLPAGISIREFEEIVDEAYNEYPTEANTDLGIGSHLDRTLRLTAKRQEWFLKWFGGKL